MRKLLLDTKCLFHVESEIELTTFDFFFLSTYIFTIFIPGYTCSVIQFCGPCQSHTKARPVLRGVIDRKCGHSNKGEVKPPIERKRAGKLVPLSSHISFFILSKNIKSPHANLEGQAGWFLYHTSTTPNSHSKH